VPLGISSDLPIESNIQPPVKIGGLRIPYVRNVSAVSSATLAGGELFTLTWLDPVDIPGLSHFLIFAANMYDPQLEPVLVGAARRSPGHVVVQVPTTRTVIFYVQTVLSNGFSTDLAKSPSVTVTATASTTTLNKTRYLRFSEQGVLVTGDAKNGIYDNAGVVFFPSGADSSVKFWVHVPDDAVTAGNLVLQLDYRMGTTPGVSRQVKLLTTFKAGNTSYSESTGDTIAIDNDTNWHGYTATVNILAGGGYAVGDLLQVTIRRDVSVASNAPAAIGVAMAGVRYTSSA